MKVFALLSKHQGFKEEREWRIIYFQNRDTLHLLEKSDFLLSWRRGIEPKLKFKVEPLMLEPRETWTF